MHEFEWNVKQITGWIFDILIYWVISYKNSWSPQLDFIPLALHHICHRIVPYSFHSYEPASQERLVVARAVKNYLPADTETVSRGLSLSTDQTSFWDALTCRRTWRLFFLGCEDISQQTSFCTAAGKGPQPGAKMKGPAQPQTTQPQLQTRPWKDKLLQKLKPPTRQTWALEAAVQGGGSRAEPWSRLLPQPKLQGQPYRGAAVRTKGSGTLQVPLFAPADPRTSQKAEQDLATPQQWLKTWGKHGCGKKLKTLMLLSHLEFYLINFSIILKVVNIFSQPWHSDFSTKWKINLARAEDKQQPPGFLQGMYPCSWRWLSALPAGEAVE